MKKMSWTRSAYFTFILITYFIFLNCVHITCVPVQYFELDWQQENKFEDSLFLLRCRPFAFSKIHTRENQKNEILLKFKSFRQCFGARAIAINNWIELWECFHANDWLFYVDIRLKFSMNYLYCSKNQLLLWSDQP